MKNNDLSEVVSVDRLSLAFTCRTCLSTDPDQQMTPIFEGMKASGKFDLSDLVSLLNLKIAKDDGYPASICSICLDRLEAVDAFRRQCVMAQEYLEENFIKLPKREFDFNTDNFIYFLEHPEPLDDSRKSEPREEDGLLDSKEGITKSTEIRIEHECAQCGMKFFDITQYQHHLDSGHHNSVGKPKKRKQVFKCSHCDKSFTTRRNWKRHEVEHEGIKSYLCNICGKGFLRDYYLKCHLKLHDGTLEKYTCDICKKQYPRKESLKTHMDIHLNKRAHQCDQCGMKFNHPNTLRGHMKLHTTKKMHHCEFCEESFSRNYDLNRHRLMVHNRTEESVKIDHQSQETNDESSLKALVKVEENPPKKRRKRPTVYKPYCCEVCGKSFKIPSALENHVKVHTENRKYVCKECGDAFKGIGYLKNHINAVHLKHKPHTCEVCKKSFARTGDLNRHRQMHAATKLHLCSICGKGFAWSRSLKAHMRDHTGEKPHVCIICNVSFSRIENLVHHTRVVHIEAEMNIRKGTTTSTT